MTEGTSLISYIIRHVTEETGVKHAKEDFENDTDFEAIPIPSIMIMGFGLPFIGLNVIDFTPQSIRLFRRSIFILRLNPYARIIENYRLIIMSKLFSYQP